ncbi:hypothetical protein D3C83_225340 [compost metagenome]
MVDGQGSGVTGVKKRQLFDIVFVAEICFRIEVEIFQSAAGPQPDAVFEWIFNK